MVFKVLCNPGHSVIRFYDVTVPTRESARVALNYQGAAAAQAALFLRVQVVISAENKS